MNFFSKDVNGYFFFNIKLFLKVSCKPPDIEVITAHPLDALSIAVRPNGSCHVGLTTLIEDFSKNFNNFLCSSQFKIFKFLCLKEYFSLGSLPMTIAFQSNYFQEF